MLLNSFFLFIYLFLINSSKVPEGIPLKAGKINNPRGEFIFYFWRKFPSENEKIGGRHVFFYWSPITKNKKSFNQIPFEVEIKKKKD